MARYQFSAWRLVRDQEERLHRGLLGLDPLQSFREELRLLIAKAFLRSAFRHEYEHVVNPAGADVVIDLDDEDDRGEDRGPHTV